MSGIQLATMSTALWVVATVALFILLAEWSTGTSWGLTASIVRGVRGWADRDGRTMLLRPPSTEPLRPILDPYAFVRRGHAGPLSNDLSAADTPPSIDLGSGADVFGAEIIDLGERRLP